MNKDILIGLFIPFFGTALGSGLVLLMKREFNFLLKDFLTALAGGIMVAASVWSLIIPATEDSAYLGRFAFIPSCIGIISGVVFMIILGRSADKICAISGHNFKDLPMLLAVTIHNIPEGMAVGSAFVAAIEHSNAGIFASAVALSVGIGVQNIPEGAIISMPLFARGVKKNKAFWIGALSGIVEPIGAAIALLMAKTIGVLLPYFLTFAAGAMLFAVSQQMIPEIKYNGKIPLTGIAFTFGFMIMMSLDVALS